jgi:DNA polymerase-3 subunit delta'
MPGRLLPTIRSRCRALALAPLPESTIVDLLAAYAPDMASADARALAQLSDGSIGEALTLAASDGLDLSREVDRLMGGLRPLDVVAVHALGDRVGRAGAEESFLTLGRLVERSLAELIRQRARGEGAGQGAASRGGGGLAKWLEVWENVGRLFVQAGSINLNRKQVVVSAFLALEAAARG